MGRKVRGRLRSVKDRRLEADDAPGILQLARYAARSPVAIQRLHYDAR